MVVISLGQLKDRQVTDLDVTDLVFLGPGFHSARQVLRGDVSSLNLDHFYKHLSSVLGRLVAPYRAILRYYRCDTPYRAIPVKGG